MDFTDRREMAEFLEGLKKGQNPESRSQESEGKTKK
jgi:hypothetical protein